MEVICGLLLAAVVFLCIHFATADAGGSLDPYSTGQRTTSSQSSKPATCFDGNWDNDGSAQC
jgi:hypothetical protein